MNEWQTIDTAPRDGTEILAWRRDCGVILVRWTAPCDFLTTSEIESRNSESDDEYDWFYADFISGDRLDYDEEPSHWMPLPTPPTDRRTPEVAE